MRREAHVRFLGGWARATASSYPTDTQFVRLGNQRLPQMVCLFKFLEGDLHRSITLFDRTR